MDACVSEHAGAIRQGVAVPSGEGFRIEEALFRRIYADKTMRESIGMRVLTDDDIDWIRKLKRLANIGSIVHHDTGFLYCLSGRRFPWACFGREFSMLKSARLVLSWGGELLLRRWRRKFRAGAK